MKAIAAAIFATLSFALPAGHAQAHRPTRIGYLTPAGSHNSIDQVFDQSLRELGYVDGQNLRIERRYTAGRIDTFAGAAAELVQLNVDLIVVWTPAGTRAVRDATTTTPIVFLARGEAVQYGLVANRTILSC